MKSERRHDLKTNNLALVMADFPGFMREYGSRILLVVLICALAIVLIFNWTRGRSEQDIRARESLTNARQSLNSVHRLIQIVASAQPWNMPPSDAIAAERDKRVKDANDQITAALESGDPNVKADAYVIRGDLNMALAMIPALPGSATQPGLNGRKGHDELIRGAEEAYTEVLKGPLNQNESAVRNARFGLGAIAEDEHMWDKARQCYQIIIDTPSVGAPFKDLARQRLDAVATLEKPLMLGSRVPASEIPGEGATSQPSTESSATNPATTEPTTLPTTVPGLSTTRPATRP